MSVRIENRAVGTLRSTAIRVRDILSGEMFVGKWECLR